MHTHILILAFAFLAAPLLFAGGDVQVETLAKSDTMWDGTSLPDFSDKETEVTILRITIPPHTTLPVHKHPVINAGYMLSGQLTVQSEEGKTKLLKEGDALIELVDKWHFGMNATDEPAVIVVFYLGTEGDPVSITRQVPEPVPAPSLN
jgi:quercetin dioxygenase-like cupin family protein